MAEVSGMRETVIQEGCFAVEPGWDLYYRFRSNPKADRTWIFLNGLGDDHTVWNGLIDDFHSVNTLQVDLRGQGRSLLKRLSTHPESNFSFRIPAEAQSDDLWELIQHLAISTPVAIAGFSYGGGIALNFASRFPGKVDKLALIVPFVIRLDKAFPLQRIWSLQWSFLKASGVLPGFITQSAENHYETFLSHYMNHRYEKRLTNPAQRQAAIELSHGIMEFNAFTILGALPEGSVFLMTADLDTLVPRSLYREFWSRLPEKCRGHWSEVEDGEHLLLEQKPQLVRRWLGELIGS